MSRGDRSVYGLHTCILQNLTYRLQSIKEKRKDYNLPVIILSICDYFLKAVCLGRIFQVLHIPGHPPDSHEVTGIKSLYICLFFLRSHITPFPQFYKLGQLCKYLLTLSPVIDRSDSLPELRGIGHELHIAYGSGYIGLKDIYE